MKSAVIDQDGIQFAVNAVEQNTMRAAQYHRYGPPEVLRVQRIPVPEPQRGEVMVRVFGTSVNPADAMVRAGKFKLFSGRSFPRGTGYDFAGVIAAVGPGVDPASVGQRVWGTKPTLNSAMTAEYVCVDEALTARAPERLDLVTAAALPTVGLTALLALRTVELAAGQSVLIVGAAGGVGSAALQLAGVPAPGARVGAVCSADNADSCLKLGAETTFDYGDLTRLRQPAARRMFDAIIDLHGADIGFYRRLVKRQGRIVSLSAKSLGYSLLVSPFTPGPKVRRGQAEADSPGSRPARRLRGSRRTARGGGGGLPARADRRSAPRHRIRAQPRQTSHRDRGALGADSDSGGSAEVPPLGQRLETGGHISGNSGSVRARGAHERAGRSHLP